jgi:hypothetical protein
MACRRTGNPYFVLGGRPDFQVTLRASQDGRQLASTTLVRQDGAAVGTRARPLARSTGLHGTLFLPADTSHPRPAVLEFGRTATGLVLQLGGTSVDNAEDGGAARTRLLALLAALH